MKKIILLFMFALNILFVNAQIAGGFGCADPDAWFDKEIYFWCKNNATNYYGYGLNLSSVSLVVNGEDQYDVDGFWQYGTYLFLDASNNIEFEKGSTVAIYVNGQYIDSWRCPTSNPTTTDVIMHAFKKKPRGKMNLNGVLKILKKIKFR